MALAEHLRELRKRFILAAIGVLLGGILGWVFYRPVTIGTFHFEGVFDLLQQPIEMLQADRPELVSLNFQGIGTAFDMQIRISLFTGILLSSPWWIYQVLAFITPGLTRQEKQYTFGFLGAAVPLFATGALLAWSVLPKALEVLIADFTPDNTTNLLAADVYLKFVMQIVLAFGIAFLLPLIMVALNFMNVVKGSTWLKGWRWAIIGIFTFCAFATPNPEPTAMLFMALPIVGLYFIAVLICHLHDKRVAKRRAEEDAELAGDSSASSNAVA
jgi:sec-independent protein translocase protein TatC